jgi:energy-coupling factor transporter ATP-binding protein EcfA2
VSSNNHTTNQKTNNSSNSSGSRRRSLSADLIVKHLKAAYKLDPFLEKGDTRKAWVSIRVGGHIETYPVSSNHFENWVTAICSRRFNKVPGKKAIDGVIRELSGRAVLTDPKKVYYRIAHHNGKIYIDVGNKEFQVIEISKDDDPKILDQSPVAFFRTPHMLPLPIYSNSLKKNPNESLETLLSKFIDIDPDQFILLVSWLISAYSEGPYPILVLTGEQGSGKTTIAKFLKQIIDPSEANIGSLPRNERDIQLLAKNSWVISIDNISDIDDWLSDTLCRISTGSAYQTRKLYTDDELFITRAKRPIILNGIADFAGRPDLLDRSIVIELPVITQYKQEGVLKEKFSDIRSAIFRAILTVLKETLSNIDNVRNNPQIQYSRMADFELWINAAEISLTWPIGKFQQIYHENRNDAKMVGLSQSRVGEAMIKFAEYLVSKNLNTWTGTMTELTEQLADRYPQFSDQHKYLVSKDPRALSRELNKVVPNLRSIGINYDSDRSRTRRDKIISIEKVFTQVYSTSNVGFNFP